HSLPDRGRAARRRRRDRRIQGPARRRQTGHDDRRGPEPARGLNVMVFSAFERMVAMRYLRARRQEGFISVIAGFSLLGIALGVAPLIIVMAVMNGVRAELLGHILGLSGHLNVFAAQPGPMQ